MIIAKDAAFDLHDAGTNITMRDMFFSKGGGVRIFRSILGRVNIYVPYRWSVYVNERFPNRAQLRSKTIPKGKYVRLKNLFIFFT